MCKSIKYEGLNIQLLKFMYIFWAKSVFFRFRMIKNINKNSTRICLLMFLFINPAANLHAGQQHGTLLKNEDLSSNYKEDEYI